MVFCKLSGERKYLDLMNCMICGGKRSWPGRLLQLLWAILGECAYVFSVENPINKTYWQQTHIFKKRKGPWEGHCWPMSMNDLFTILCVYYNTLQTMFYKTIEICNETEKKQWVRERHDNSALSCLAYSYTTY